MQVQTCVCGRVSPFVTVIYRMIVHLCIPPHDVVDVIMLFCIVIGLGYLYPTLIPTNNTQCLRLWSLIREFDLIVLYFHM